MTSANPMQSYLDWVSVIVPGQPCTINEDMAELVHREFCVEARIARAVKAHRKRSHLRQFMRERMAGWLKVAA